MHKTYRIGLFLVLIIVFSMSIITQSQEVATPTGKLIYGVYESVNSENTTTLFLYDFASETSSRLSPEGDSRKDIVLSFSPDGGRVAFVADGVLSFIGANGDGLLTTDIQNPLFLSWSSDNSRVAFLTESDDVYTLNVYSVDNAENRAYDGDLTLSIDSLPTWAIDGNGILLSARESEDVNKDIYALSADFATFTNITNTVGTNESSPAMSPDGQFISYKTDATDGPLGYIWVMNSDGSNPRQLTDFSLPLGSLYTPHIWSPDSTRFLVEDAGQGVAIINIVTDEIVDFDGINAVWSPDGRLVAYQRTMPNSKGFQLYNIWIAPVDDIEAGTIALNATLGKIAWQPDPSVTFEPIILASPTPTATETPSTPQSFIESVLEQGGIMTWFFDGFSGDEIVLTANSTEFDTFLQLYGINGTVLAENDDYYDGTNSQIIITLPADGIYQVVVSAYYGDMRGAYTLILAGTEGELREKIQGGIFVVTPTPTFTETVEASPTATFTHTPSPTPTLTPTPTITPSPTFGFDRGQCPANLPPRLAVDGRGRVLPGGASTVYEQPLSDSAILGEIPGGVSFTVLDGPVCTNNQIWWQVEYRDVTGWVIEAGNGEYFLEPLRR